MLVYGRKITPAEVFARIDAVDLKRVKEVANQTFINKPVAVAGYGPVASLPSIEWLREKVHV